MSVLVALLRAEMQCKYDDD